MHGVQMDVKLGFRQSELGMIPKEWEILRFQDIADKSVPWSIAGGPFGSSLKVSDYVREGVRIIQLQNIGEGTFNDNYAIFTSEEKANELLSNNIYPGEIILSKMGDPVARCCFVPPGDQRYVMASDGIRLAVDSKRFNKRFVHEYINSPYFRNKAVDASKGSTRLRIALTDLKQLPFVAPPLPEQRAIAEVLGDMDALIAALDRLITKKRAIKQGAIQQLLTGKKRLPGFMGEWAERTLLDLAGGKKELFDDGDWIESEHITSEGIRLIQTGNIGIGTFIERDNKKFVFEKSFVSLRCKEIRQGDLLICRLADPAGRSCVLPDIGEAKIITSVDVTIFRPPSSAANRVFLTNLFSTDQWFRAVSDRSGGTTHKRISRGALGRLMIRVPPVEEQNAIAGILSDMDAEIDALEVRREKTRALKQGLMQVLLTGRIRLL